MTGLPIPMTNLFPLHSVVVLGVTPMLIWAQLLLWKLSPTLVLPLIYILRLCVIRLV